MMRVLPFIGFCSSPELRRHFCDRIRNSWGACKLASEELTQGAFWISGTAFIFCESTLKQLHTACRSPSRNKGCALVTILYLNMTPIISDSNHDMNLLHRHLNVIFLYFDNFERQVTNKCLML